MTSQYRHRRTSSPSTPFPGLLEPGEIAVNTANRQLALGDADGATIGAPLQLLTIRFFDIRAQYAINDYVLHGGAVYRAKGSISPGAFNASNWDVAANPGTFVMRAGDSMTGHLVLPPTPGATNAVRKDYVDAAATALDTAKVNRSGDTLTGFLTLHADPDAAMKAATKQYVDSKPVLAVSDTPPANPQDNLLWWDSDTGTLYLRYNDGAGTPQWVQAVAMPAIDTAAFVQKSGDTMLGALTLAGNPTVALHAVPKQYADTKLSDAPVDEKSYARRGATWAEVPRYQSVSLAGGKSFDVQVPAGAKAVRFTGSVVPTTATAIQLYFHISVSAGVFIGTAGQFIMNGFVHYTSAPNTVLSLVNDTTRTGLLVAPSHESVGQPVTFDGHMTLTRPLTSTYYKAQIRSQFIIGGNHYSSFYTNLASGGAVGLSVLALRLMSPVGDNFAAESHINMEWM